MPSSPTQPARADVRPRPRLAFRRKAVAQSPFYGQVLETYKSDGRSCVWSMRSDAGVHVVKRFVYTPARQRAGLWLGADPAQRELRQNRALQRAAVPVAPIVDAGVERPGADASGGAGLSCGCHVWLMTPQIGRSLQHLLKYAEADDAQRERWIDAAAALTCQLMNAGFTFRDLKPSNIVIDEDGEALLLDVGSVRRSRSSQRVAKMLALMDRVLARDGVNETLRRRYAGGVGAGVSSFKFCAALRLGRQVSS